ncbi:MAG: hypothetical protein HY756_09940 [Nitrospirae bacterium]|nr:hypothetical protein [Nitrospirota bacterium]
MNNEVQKNKELDNQKPAGILEKLRQGPARCPFCKEELSGWKELGAHLKERHCH